MILTHLRILNVRNISEADLDLAPGMTMVLGANAQGKTTLLEAIYLLATGESHRAQSDDEWLRHGADEAAVRGAIDRPSGSFTLEIRHSRRGRKLRRKEGRPYHPGKDPLGDFRAVLFSPDDLDLVKAGPAVRRRFLDVEIGQGVPGYQDALTRYQRALQQRNAALRMKPARPELAAVYTEPVAIAGARVISWRRQIVDALNPWLHSAMEGIAAGEHVHVRYEPALRGAEATADGLAAAIHASRVEELARGFTVVGPHRDDLPFYVGDHPLRLYGSQGQQRSAAIAAKIAVLQYLTAKQGQRPILLLDDVLSELDAGRRAGLASFLTEGQTVVTTTDRSHLPSALVPGGIVLVEEGKVTRGG